MSEQEGMSSKKKDFSDWFHEVIEKAELIDQRYPLQGFLVYPAYGYGLFENCMRALEEILARTGHKKCYFPLLIPEKLLNLEKEHIAHLKGEVFWVTHSGEKEMPERAALRPTSETAMYSMLKLWIRSYKDLPLKIHQSTSVYRYETKHTRPLMRDREIMWNEAHTAHASMEDADKQIIEGVGIYQELYDRLCIPVYFFDMLVGIFPGAKAAVEAYALFPDNKGIEMGSVNNLGQRFSKAFDIQFVKKDGSKDHVYQTCYGVSERLVAAIAALHGDDKGLIIPPSVAPIQIIIVPVYKGEGDKEVDEYCKKVEKELKDACFRVESDLNPEYTAGWKYNHYELRGVPLRIEIGSREVKNKSVTIAKRTGGKKEEIKLSAKKIGEILDSITDELRKSAEKKLHDSISKATSIPELKEKLEKNGGFIGINWCSSGKCADEIKERTEGGEVLGTLHNKTEKASGKCINCGKEAKHLVYVVYTY